MKNLYKKINSNLNAKIVIFVTAILSVFFTAYIAYNVNYETRFYINATKTQLSLLADTIEQSLVDAMARNERDEVQRVMERIGASENISDLRIFKNNVVLRSSIPSEIGMPVDENIRLMYEQNKTSFINGEGSARKLYLIKPIMNRSDCFGCHPSTDAVNGVLAMGFSLKDVDAGISGHIKSMVTSALLISILIAASLIVVLQVLVNRPIRRLKKGMDTAERGGEVSFKKTATDEIGLVQDKFEQMIAKIRELHEENTQKELEIVKTAEAAHSHAKLKSIMDAMPDGITILSSDMMIHDLNPRSREIFPGIEKGDFCYRSIHGRSEPCSHCSVLKVFQDGGIHEHQSTFYLPDGKDRIVHSISAPLIDGGGNIINAIEVVRDITDRVKADKIKAETELLHKKELEEINQQLAGRVNEVEEANNQIAMLIRDLANKNTQLEKVVDRLTTVNQIGNILNSVVDKDNVVEVIVTTLAKTMGAEICSLMLVNTNSDELEVAYAVGLDGKRLRNTAIGEGISGYVAKEGKPLLVVDIEKDPRFKLSNDPQYNTTSLVAAPLFVKGNVVGILNVNNKLNGSPFNQDDLDLLTTVAGQAAIAVENSNLYKDIRSSYFDTVRALVNALEAKDKYSKGHSERVTLLAMMIADEMGLPEDKKQSLQHAGVLHDIGKIGISLNILNKGGKLTGEEYDVIKDHPLIGEKILDPITFLKDVKTIVGEHHERFDGKGYPHQKKGSELSLEARILAVADTFDALTSDRPYRKALPFEDAVAEIVRCSSSQFDPQVVEIFLRAINAEDLLANIDSSSPSDTNLLPENDF